MPRHQSLLARERTVLLLIDFQESYRRVLRDWNEVTERAAVLLRGCRLLGIPVLVTEQYPKGLGHTAAELAGHLAPDRTVFEKLSLSCMGSSAFVEALTGLERRQVLIAGIETHACVTQTVHDLLSAGFQVHLARDAIASRRPQDFQPAWDRMRAAGMLPTTAEGALLELVCTAEAPEFKSLQALLKE
jgi:nicotinamidase-related amidase